MALQKQVTKKVAVVTRELKLKEEAALKTTSHLFREHDAERSQTTALLKESTELKENLAYQGVEHHTSLQQLKNSMQLKVELNDAYAWAEKLTAKECDVLRKESQNLIKSATLDQAKVRDLRSQTTQKDGEIARLNRQLSYQVAVQSSSDLRIKGLEKQNAGLKGLSTQPSTKTYNLPENATQPQQLKELFANSNSVTEGVSGPLVHKTGPWELGANGGRDLL
jgi:leucyl aminopeptidase